MLQRIFFVVNVVSLLSHVVIDALLMVIVPLFDGVKVLQVVFVLPRSLHFEESCACLVIGFIGI